MTLKKQIIALVAAAVLAGPTAANASTSPGPTGISAQPGIIAILIGLLVPAVQSAREAARR